MRVLFAVAAVSLAALTGCGSYVDPGTVEDVEVTGKVTGPDGRAITGVNIYFQPAAAGSQPMGFPLKADGSFAGKMKRGTYLYYLTPKGEGDRAGEAILSRLPEAYRKANPERTIDARAGELQLKF